MKVDNDRGHRLPLIELILYIYDNFCVTKIKYIISNWHDFPKNHIHLYFPHLILCIAYL
jgi:hypothetical protein